MSTYTKTSPYLSSLLERKCLNKDGSTKATYHLSLSIDPEKLQYTPGDSIAVLPNNHEEDVARIIKIIPDEKIMHPKTGVPVLLSEFLYTMANLERVTSPLSRALGVTDFDRTAYDVVTFLEEFGHVDPDLLAKALPPLLPRFYSIASNHADKIDLLVSTFQYTKGDRKKSGVGSDFLCHKVELGDPIPFYVSSNEKFSIPSPDTDIIMIGPGTGVAPYRAFLQARENASGKNWLFFGERNRAHDFYYEDFFTQLEQAGKLKLTTAFSRDQAEKIYVQHRLTEEAKDVWKWLENGAIVYVCGDAKQMAKDVDHALHAIAQTQGNMSAEEAHLFIRTMRKNKRYLMDVY